MNTTLGERLKAANLTDQEIGTVEKTRPGTEISNIRYLATKGDVTNLRTEVKTDIANLRTELKTDMVRVQQTQDILMWISGICTTVTCFLPGYFVAKLH